VPIGAEVAGNGLAGGRLDDVPVGGADVAGVVLTEVSGVDAADRVLPAATVPGAESTRG
jgi:hypothetical protein